MSVITGEEYDALPDWKHISRIEKEEFEVYKINYEKEYFWVSTEDSRHVMLLVNHISPDSNVGKMLSKLKEGRYVTLSAVRLEKDKDHMPHWYVTGISSVRDARGPERNAFQ